MRLVHQLQQHGGAAVEKHLFPRERHADHRAHQLLVVVLQQSAVVFRRVGVVQNAPIFHRNIAHFLAAAVQRAPQAALTRIGKDGVKQA